MTLPLDYARCADGRANCRRAEECARAQWPTGERCSTVPFWREHGLECMQYIPIRGLATKPRVER